MPILDGLNKHDKVYHELSYDILTSKKLNFRISKRTVVPTIGVFGLQTTYDLSDGSIPLSQTKPIAIKTQLLPEIVGFLKNENNLKWYLEHGMKIWTPNAFNFYRNKLPKNHPWKKLVKDSVDFNKTLVEYEELILSGKNPEAGDLGNFYPKQWHEFEGVKKTDEGLEIIHVNQIENLIDMLKNDPTGRYAVVTAWNPVDVRLKRAALAPCHNMFQAYRYTDIDGVERLDVKMYQRSADTFLGVQFNNGQYSFLTKFVASAIGVQPGDFIHTFGDIHFYVGQGKRAEWYSNRKNLSWLQKEIKTKHPDDVLDNLLRKLPSEENLKGYDHIPYIIKQLGRESVADVPTVEYTYDQNKSLDENLKALEVSSFKVDNYKFKDRAEKVQINGIDAKMAS